MEQQLMDIDSSPVPRRQQHTCNNLLSVSPSSSVMEFVSEPVVTRATAVPVTNATGAVSKKCTCPYERPTLKTMEAAAAAGLAPSTSSTILPANHLYQMSSQSAHLPLSAGAAAVEEKVLVESEEDIRNANVTHLEDNLNNNNSSNTNIISGSCDNTRSGDDKDANSNPSIITVQAATNDNVVVVGGSSEPVKAAEKKKKSLESDELKKKKKSSDSSSSGKKKQSSSDDHIRCSCSEVQLRVKAAESPPPPKIGMGRSSLNDGILSNCLSALNFVSGNRIGGGSDSKLGSSSSNSNGTRSPRNSKSHKSSSSADSLDSNSSQLCGENCSKKGQSAPEMTQPPPNKLCKMCRGHGLAQGGNSSSSSGNSSTGKESKDSGHVVPSKTKRSPWALRFNCARLKGPKSSSSVTSTTAAAPKEPTVCKCSPESTTKPVSVAAVTKNISSKKKKKSSGNNNNTHASEEPTTATAEVISGASMASSCSRVTTAPVGTPSNSNRNTTLSSTVNFGFISNKESNSATMNVPSSASTTTTGVNPIVNAVQDSSRLSFTSLSTDDCDEWARMQREKEIEDGVEAPPGYLPKFQINKIQSSATATQSSPGTNNSLAANQQGGGSNTNATQSVATLQQQQLMQIPSLGGLSSSQWPHVICASSPEWQQQQRFLMQQALLAHQAANQSPQGPKVHSQVDFIHCLVPDLQKITSCGFYWGKMDRYQAETLLDGKPEGTFLLRDSAQEEFLFSVSFRKYGRSLHARIEQFNHKFSFDSHDPGVYTANTVTGLLEHYKDPSCVMFFEPMLTQPLNRNFCFSLQQLCRATIVSETTYDNIGDLKLPHLMKGYLKEYHYKQKVRVKMFDELRST